MTDPTRPRRAPWKSAEGRDTYLVSDAGGMLSQLADAKEANMINTAGHVLEWAIEAIDDQGADLRFVAEQLTEALAAALTVAELRRERL